MRCLILRKTQPTKTVSIIMNCFPIVILLLYISHDLMSITVKRAYHRLSLKFHPDRVSEEQKTEATEKFKVISAIHSILSNKSKRQLYDKTGTFCMYSQFSVPGTFHKVMLLIRKSSD